MGMGVDVRGDMVEMGIQSMGWGADGADVNHSSIQTSCLN